MSDFDFPFPPSRVLPRGRTYSGRCVCLDGVVFRVPGIRHARFRLDLGAPFLCWGHQRDRFVDWHITEDEDRLAWRLEHRVWVGRVVGFDFVRGLFVVRISYVQVTRSWTATEAVVGAALGA